VLPFSDSINPNIQFQLSVPENIATIQNVSLVNKDGNKLGHLQYNPGTDLLPAIDIPENKLSSGPLYLLLTASTHDGKYSWIRDDPQQQQAIHNQTEVLFPHFSQCSIHNVVQVTKTKYSQRGTVWHSGKLKMPPGTICHSAYRERGGKASCIVDINNK
jgi:hypothetical protein